MKLVSSRTSASVRGLLSAMAVFIGLTGSLCLPARAEDDVPPENEVVQQEDVQPSLDCVSLYEGLGWLVAAVSLGGGATLGAHISKAVWDG